MQRNRPLIIGAAVLGILAIGLTLMSLLGRGGSSPAPGQPGGPPAVAATPTARQLVAARPIAPRTVITREMLREDASQAAVAGALTDSKQIVGKLAGNGIAAGEVFTPALLVEPIKRTTPANFAIPPGLRAVAVMVDPNTTVGGIVDVGDRVDVVAVHKVRYRNEADRDDETRSGRTISQNLLVLATDAAIKQATAPAATPATPGAPGAAPAAAGAPPPPPPPPPAPPAPGTPTPKVRVVLAALPLDAERIAAAQGLGEIHLTMRDPLRNDQAAQPEVFEYPVRTLGRRTVPARPNNGGGNNGGTGGGNGGARSSARPAQTFRDTPDVSYAQQPSMPSMMTPPVTLPPASVATPGNTQSDRQSENGRNSSEVTVIRGTEKTKVSVPQQ